MIDTYQPMVIHDTFFSSVTATVKSISSKGLTCTRIRVYILPPWRSERGFSYSRPVITCIALVYYSNEQMALSSCIHNMYSAQAQLFQFLVFPFHVVSFLIISMGLPQVVNLNSKALQSLLQAAPMMLLFSLLSRSRTRALYMESNQQRSIVRFFVLFEVLSLSRIERCYTQKSRSFTPANAGNSIHNTLTCDV